MEVSLYRLSGSAADVARAVELEVFSACYGDTPELLAESYGPYEAASTFLLAVVGEQPAGVLRYILPSAAGNKTVNDTGLSLAVHGVKDGEGVMDIGTLAKREAFRHGPVGGAVSMMLMAAAFRDALHAGIQHATAILAPKAYESLLRRGIPLEPLAGSEPFTYLGVAKSQAVYLRVASLVGVLGDVPSVQATSFGSQAGYEPTTVAANDVRVEAAAP